MKGVSGYMLAVIITIIIAIILIALAWIFFKSGTEAMMELFDQFIQSVYGSICGILGTWGKFLLPGAC